MALWDTQRETMVPMSLLTNTERRLDEALARERELSDRLAALTREGYRPAPQDRTPEPEPELPAEVLRAIVHVAPNPTSDTRRLYVASAMECLGSGLSEDAVVRLIDDGELR